MLHGILHADAHTTVHILGIYLEIIATVVACGIFNISNHGLSCVLIYVCLIVRIVQLCHYPGRVGQHHNIRNFADGERYIHILGSLGRKSHFFIILSGFVGCNGKYQLYSALGHSLFFGYDSFIASYSGRAGNCYVAFQVACCQCKRLLLCHAEHSVVKPHNCGRRSFDIGKRAWSKRKLAGRGRNACEIYLACRNVCA